uniref:Uncharacterized protein n=1 Tax=Physcomitrium patens TaxID=3218 RepID=A0A7I4EA03_PHYPA
MEKRVRRRRPWRRRQQLRRLQSEVLRPAPRHRQVQQRQMRVQLPIRVGQLRQGLEERVREGPEQGRQQLRLVRQQVQAAQVPRRRDRVQRWQVRGAVHEGDEVERQDEVLRLGDISAQLQRTIYPAELLR